MSALATASEIAGIVSTLVFPLGAALVYGARHWIRREIVVKLSNDDTPVAKYAHDARDAANDARDYSKDAKDFARQAFETSRDTHQLVVDHITNTGIHRVSR